MALQYESPAPPPPESPPPKSLEFDESLALDEPLELDESLELKAALEEPTVSIGSADSTLRRWPQCAHR